MKVLMESWRRFITEVEPPAGFAPGISEPTSQERPEVAATEVSKNMGFFLKRFPLAEDPKRRDLFATLVKKQAPRVQEQIRNTYSSKKNADSFVRFIQNVRPSETPQNILSNWEIYKNTALNALNVPVVTFHERIDEIPADYLAKNVGAYYDVDKKVIFVNPFVYVGKGGLSHGALVDDMKEEYIHAAQSFIRHELKMPVAQMQTRAAKGADIFLSQEESGLSPAEYKYLTGSQDFHAKMLRLKSNIAKQSPESYDEGGRIRKDVLLKLMQSPNSPEILRVLDPRKIDKVLQFFNMVAKTKPIKTSEFA